MPINLPFGLPGLPRLPDGPGGPPGLADLHGAGGDGDAPLPALPPGIGQRVLERGFDSLPPGLARQLGPPGTPTSPAGGHGGPLPGNPPALPSPGGPPAGPPTVPTAPGAPAPGPSPVSPPPAGSLPAGGAQGTGGPLPSLPLPGAQPPPVSFPGGAGPGPLIRGMLSPALPPAPIAQPGASGTVPSGPASLPAPAGAPVAGMTGMAAPVTASIPSQPAQAVPTQAPVSGNPGVPLGPASTAALPTAPMPANQRAEAGLPLPRGESMRSDPGLATRPASLPGTNMPPAAAAAAAAVATLATPGPPLAAGATLSPLLAVVPTSPSPLDVRGNTLGAVGDRTGMARPDPAFTGVYTGDGPQRQRLRSGLPASSMAFAHWLDVLGVRAGRMERDAEENAAMADAMQWMFWILAIIAYACLGFAIVALLPAASDVLGHHGRRWTGAFAVGGLVAAAGAWVLARRMGLLPAGVDGSRSQGRRGDGQR